MKLQVSLVIRGRYVPSFWTAKMNSQIKSPFLTGKVSFYKCEETNSQIKSPQITRAACIAVTIKRTVEYPCDPDKWLWSLSNFFFSQKKFISKMRRKKFGFFWWKRHLTCFGWLARYFWKYLDGLQKRCENTLVLPRYIKVKVEHYLLLMFSPSKIS